MGKGLLIATAGFALAAIFGHPATAPANLWNVLAMAVAGTSCLAAAVLIRREQCDAEDAVKRDVRRLVSLVEKLPGVESPDHEVSEERGAFAARLDRERAEQALLGKGR